MTLILTINCLVHGAINCLEQSDKMDDSQTKAGIIVTLNLYHQTVKRYFDRLHLLNTFLYFSGSKMSQKLVLSAHGWQGQNQDHPSKSEQLMTCFLSASLTLSKFKYLPLQQVASVTCFK